MIRNAWFIGLVGISLLATGPVWAQDQDVEGSQDHPLISRYEGSVILNYEAKEFDEYTLPLGPYADNVLAEHQTLEGKVTRMMYLAPKGRSTLEVYRNYEMALKQTGFEVLFDCSKEA